MAEEKILTFGEFRKTNRYQIPRCGHFHLFFLEATLEERGEQKYMLYRTQPFFKKFQKENSELEKKLSKGIVKLVREGKESVIIKLFGEDLYEAYKIMRGYGISDLDLFTPAVFKAECE